MQYDNTNTGMLKRNPNRETEKHPEFTGSINIEGVEYWLSAWVNTAKEGSKIAGQKYFHLKVNPKDTPPKAKKPAQAFDDSDLDDDIPF